MSVEEPSRSAQHCTITITMTINDADDLTRAVARMDWHNHNLVGVGRTRRSENFPDRHSEQLSISRALSNLIAQLGTCAPGDIRAVTRPSRAGVVNPQ